MEKHRCKLCYRSFSNGRALGGHMRSHVMNDYTAKKAAKIVEQQLFDENLQGDYDDFDSYNSISTPSSSEDEEDEEESGYELRENPKKSSILVDPEFSSVDQDRESETESYKNNPVSRRSKRVRKSSLYDFNRLCMNGFFQNHQVKKSNEQSLSSISETTTEEDVAHCLIMLSKDKWDREEEQVQEEEEEEEEKFDYSEDSGVAKVIKTKVRGKYRCETCNKLFRSYQALGGHRASHKKIKVNTPEIAVAGGAGGAGDSKAVVVEKRHECPFCHRVFSSGQALGGHKRSHFIGAGAISANKRAVSPVKPTSRTGEALNIDLNLPAPMDDEDEISQVAISAVSDAGFRLPH